MRPTNQERQTGGVDPADLARQTDPAYVEQDAAILDHDPRGVRTFTRPDLSFDPMNQTMRDPAWTTTIDSGFRVSTYTFDRGWWIDAKPSEVGRQVAQLPEALVDVVHAEVTQALRSAALRWAGACRANGSAHAARAE